MPRIDEEAFEKDWKEADALSKARRSLRSPKETVLLKMHKLHRALEEARSNVLVIMDIDHKERLLTSEASEFYSKLERNLDLAAQNLGQWIEIDEF